MVGLLWVVAMLNYFDRLMITSMHDPIVGDISMTEAQFGLLTAVFLWVYGVLSPFGGYFADRYSRKWVIVGSIVVWSAVTTWTGYATSFTEILIARAFMGISEACYIPAALALITDYHTKGSRSLAVGIHSSGLYAGMALGGLGGFIADACGWRFGFHLFGIIGIVYAVVLIFTLHDQGKQKAPKEEIASTDDEKVSALDSIKKIFVIPSFYILLIYNSVIGMAFWVIYAWLPLFLQKSFHLSLGEAGISATAYIQMASLGGVLLGGFLSDRWVALNKKGRIFSLVLSITVGAPFLFLLGVTPIFWLAVVSMIFFGLFRGFHDANLMPILCQVMDKRYRGTSYGILNFFSTIIGGAMVYIGGLIMDANISLSLVFEISALALLAGGWLLMLIKPARTE
jgi:MFS transporter, Spinster family, sphingosine-1-phosphate transporter